ncbi:hypothetical protein BC940DRAFT_327166 [Gongronella butleri]|nr:hypothetical protein BC940DRAFT_327166 [Gongronella butleri]
MYPHPPPVSPPFSPTYIYSPPFGPMPHLHPHHHHPHGPPHVHAAHSPPPAPPPQSHYHHQRMSAPPDASTSGPVPYMSPPAMMVMPHPHAMTQPFPPLHISSPVLSDQHASSTTLAQLPPLATMPDQALPPPHQHHHPQTHQHHQSHQNHHHQHEKQQQQAKKSSQQQHQQQQVQQQQKHVRQDRDDRRASHTSSSSSDSPVSSPSPPSPHQSHNVYIRGLAPDTTDDSLLAMCAEFGTVVSSKAIVDQKAGTCKGYGFAMYTDQAACQRAIDALVDKGLHASLARVGQESFSAKLRHLQDETSTNIYISNIPVDMTEVSLENLFAPHKIISSRILRDLSTGASRGVGFARLTDRESAVQIIDQFHGQTLVGSTLPLQVRFADSPAQKRLKHHFLMKREGSLYRSLSVHNFQSITSAASSINSVSTTMPATPESMLGLAVVNR